MRFDIVLPGRRRLTIVARCDGENSPLLRRQLMSLSQDLNAVLPELIENLDLNTAGYGIEAFISK